ncbi:MAG: selenide, water dikinase SelD [Anaerolineales bacterium]
MTAPVKLTSLASAAGCAAKLGPGDLSEIVFPLGDLFSPADHPALLVGLSTPDDAGVMKLNDQQAIIMTTDFFPPVVDDPYWFGAIAAANAMSDVYAMGGQVLMALNIVAFPADQPPTILRDILRGGAEKVAESGGVLVGGHTIMDDEPKYGLAVIGTVHPDKIIPKGGAQPGDSLVLTKPLGVGIINTALKNGMANPDYVQAAMENMATLNKTAAEAAQRHGVHGMSDITGYSLLGHAYEMVRNTPHNIIIEYDRLHWVPGVDEYAAMGIFPGGTGRNRAYYQQFVRLPDALAEDESILGRLYDPQTSGGLLMAVPDPEPLLADLAAAGADARLVGKVETGDGLVAVV